MPHDLFWHGEPEEAIYYRRAYELREQWKNRDMWLQGLYFYEALGDMAPVLRAFVKSGTKPRPYPSEPYAFTESEIREKEAREAKKAADATAEYLRVWAESVNKTMNESEVREHAERTDGTD